MKSGTISGAKSFAGYHTSKNGTVYTFAVIINNFDEARGNIVQKMYKVLDELK
jgi:D-alanyl-D-alanine carboxypeptidase/D-alanyl-D-alanine-endopeptidase (penicillin-binding protein 4)